MLSNKITRPTAIAVAVALGLSSCATIDKTLGESSGVAACAMGGLAGAVAGGALAAATGKDVGKGAIAGGVVGCGVTHLYQQRVKRLQAIAQEEGLAMQVSELKTVAPAATGQQVGGVESVGIEAQVQDSAMFDVGSAEITPTGQRQLRKIAAALAEGHKDAKAANKKILVVGHTDATGSAEFNQRLSEQRARAVGKILAEAGIPAANIYYQGAGASRPVADNATEEGRTGNRRVEMTEVDSQQLLVERVRDERNNTKYLAHGTASELKPPANVEKPSTGKPSAPVVAQKPSVRQPRVAEGSEEPLSRPAVNAQAGSFFIDFGGSPVTTEQSTIAQGIKPKSSIFSLISPAYASTSLSSCVGDSLRLAGEAKNLATDRALSEIDTTDYLPGMNGHPWGNAVNGHIALVGPVTILRKDAGVVQQPFMQFIADYKTAKKRETPKFQSVANTYEGEEQVLYRVFAVDQAKSPVSCMDIVFDKRAGRAVAGEIYYPKQGAAYFANYQPIRK